MSSLPAPNTGARRTERLGIAARYPGRCELCGQPVNPGDRIFHLPAKRRGASQDPWVCKACRYPDPDATPTLEQVLAKLTYRIATPGKTTSLNQRDVVVLLDYITSTVDKNAPGHEQIKDLKGFSRLNEAYHRGRAANLGRADAIDLLDTLADLGCLARPAAGGWNAPPPGH